MTAKNMCSNFGCKWDSPPPPPPPPPPCGSNKVHIGGDCQYDYLEGLPAE